MYDAVIIGAGIGGLVCGCYLAKAGMKVLIAEQHYKPGGYCTSFKREGFTFDAAAHSFGGYRDNGLVNKVFHDFKIEELIQIKRFDPSDIIMTPDCKVSFWADVTRTIEEFAITFPNEHRALKEFFHFIMNPDPMSLAHIRKWTMKKLLDRYFTEERLKTILSFPLFGNGGLPPSTISAFIGINIFREFMLDGGYYPNDSMQSLPDALSVRFLEYGGELKLSSYVRKIAIKDSKVEGIFIEGDSFYPSRYVISNCDTRQTYLNLIEEEVIHEAFIKKIKKMTPSLSMFIIYLGMSKFSNIFPPSGSNVWFLSQYDLDKAYSAAKKGDICEIDRFLVRVLPNKRCIMALSNTSFKSSKFWESNKKKYLHMFMRSIEQNIIPDLTSNVAYSDAASPRTLFRYTLNYKGAAYGWASIPSQIADIDLKQSSFIQNLYNVGHWTTQGLGIPGVVYSGYDTAKRILKKKR